MRIEMPVYVLSKHIFAYIYKINVYMQVHTFLNILEYTKIPKILHDLHIITYFNSYLHLCTVRTFTITDKYKESEKHPQRESVCVRVSERECVWE